MKRIIPFALLFACSALTAIAQPGAPQEGPLISLYLPRGFPSEKAQLQYFLTGAFGGYGDFIRPKPDRQTLDFTAAVNGRSTDRLRIIAYLPGCEVITFDFLLEGTAMWRRLDCRPLATITIHGQVPRAYLDRKSKVAISYQADWARAFFGIRDGMTPAFSLLSVVPDENGEFSAEVPDFYKQNLGHGTYLFGFHGTDRRKESNLNPVEIPVGPSYPPEIQFSPN
jgi:hypothetical protein